MAGRTIEYDKSADLFYMRIGLGRSREITPRVLVGLLKDGRYALTERIAHKQEEKQ